MEKEYNEIYQIDDLIKGIKSKISKVGHGHEYFVKWKLPKYDGGYKI